MDELNALNRQLAFVRAFYFTGSPPFEALMRKYLPQYSPLGEPTSDEFECWQEARKGLEVLGQFSLSLVEKAVHDYVRECVRCEGMHHGLKKRGKESWFDCYCRYLEENTSFRWPNSPVTRDRIEQINLCRNDFIHDDGIDSGQPKKSEHHAKRHPVSPFDDELDRAVRLAVTQVNGEAPGNDPGSLTVDRHALIIAVADAGKFCAFVEKHRTKPGDDQHR